MSGESAFAESGRYVGRLWCPEAQGPCLVRLEDGRLIGITARGMATMHDLLDADDPVGAAWGAEGSDLGTLADLLSNSTETPDPARPYLLAPCDVQAVKACGVTFATSMLERVIEEKAGGDPSRAGELRDICTRIIGSSLSEIEPGSARAEELKRALIAEDVWSQYLEVGIGPDAEVFTKGQPMSSVGHGAAVGLHPKSSWNNPEPEVVLAIDGHGTVKGATLGNDVNLRDIEGRSALLLGKAKDNNASCAIGPFVRLFDDGFGMDDVRRAELHLRVEGPDGFTLDGRSSMSEISRDPLDLVAQTMGAHHQYPDGVFLMLGTLFAPTDDRDTPGEGFTHKLGDIVHIEAEGFGRLTNTVRLSTECPPWSFGTQALAQNLAERGLL